MVSFELKTRNQQQLITNLTNQDMGINSTLWAGTILCRLLEYILQDIYFDYILQITKTTNKAKTRNYSLKSELFNIHVLQYSIDWIIPHRPKTITGQRIKLMLSPNEKEEITNLMQINGIIK